jgi:hypothetical protein
MLLSLVAAALAVFLPSAADAAQRAQSSAAARDSVAISPRAVLISEQHYQATFTLTCANDNCSRAVSVPQGFDRLIVNRVSCDVRGDSNAKFLNATFAVISPTNAPLNTIFMGPNPEAVERGIFILNAYFWDLYVTRPNRGLFLVQLTHPVTDGACTLLGRVRVVSSASGATGVREPAGPAVSGDVGIALE